ncbi:MAG: hypothetical protein M3P33_01490 [bacterium]|nr:hypothetical protein [bacterium]
MIIQILILPYNLLALFLFEILLTNKSIINVLILAVLVSLIYDSIKLAPLGTWMFTFFSVALIMQLIIKIIKVNFLENSTTISVIALRILLISIATFIHYTLYNSIIGIGSLDFKILFSIVVITTLYTTILQLLRSNNTSSLLN